MTERIAQEGPDDPAAPASLRQPAGKPGCRDETHQISARRPSEVGHRAGQISEDRQSRRALGQVEQHRGAALPGAKHSADSQDCKGLHGDRNRQSWDGDLRRDGENGAASYHGQPARCPPRQTQSRNFSMTNLRPLRLVAIKHCIHRKLLYSIAGLLTRKTKRLLSENLLIDLTKLPPADDRTDSASSICQEWLGWLCARNRGAVFRMNGRISVTTAASRQMTAMG